MWENRIQLGSSSRHLIVSSFSIYLWLTPIHVYSRPLAHFFKNTLIFVLQHKLFHSCFKQLKSNFAKYITELIYNFQGKAAAPQSEGGSAIWMCTKRLPESVLGMTSWEETQGKTQNGRMISPQTNQMVWNCSFYHLIPFVSVTLNQCLCLRYYQSGLLHI